ncbi:hypothetical protein CBR_g26182 [Chara braunii]|uniref:Hexosyltransferase n=1 Tax=Chara braunii TaxID=69332 RepID=A0A388L771_CHABU|nr:hypothetical protein CBR_g26182 [Chara braunii]|eukprot:GBG78146.1 hypothetical protein CBR_g26182 [Chara braunii]
MRLYISPGMRRITISSSLRHSDSVRLKVHSTWSYRRLFVFLLLSAFVVPLVFISAALIMLEDPTACKTEDCLYIGGRPILHPKFKILKKVQEDLERRDLNPFVEKQLDPQAMREWDREWDDGEKKQQQPVVVPVETPATLADLIELAKKSKLGTEAIISMMKAMVQKEEEKVKMAKLQRSIFRHFASKGVPKGLHCLSLRLTDEYANNPDVQQPLPPPDKIDRLTDNSLHHYVLITDNVLAASVVVASVVQNAVNKSKVVMHVITDEITFGAISGWFAMKANYMGDATIDVKSIQQISRAVRLSFPVSSWLDSSLQLQAHLYGYQAVEEELMDPPAPLETSTTTEAKHARFTPWMSQLRMYMPEVFPGLDKIVFLDDDVAVQSDLSGLWDIPMEGKVNGAVETCRTGDVMLTSKRFKSYLNFSHPVIAQNFNPEECAWAYGMNIFDLKSWRRSNITKVYLEWQKRNEEENMRLWRLGTLPPALIAFRGHVKPLSSRWHLLGLGYQPGVNLRAIEKAAVIHYNGPAKPWLDMAILDFKPFWTKYVEFDDEFVADGYAWRAMRLSSGDVPAARCTCKEPTCSSMFIHMQARLGCGTITMMPCADAMSNLYVCDIWSSALRMIICNGHHRRDGGAGGDGDADAVDVDVFSTSFQQLPDRIAWYRWLETQHPLDSGIRPLTRQGTSARVGDHSLAQEEHHNADVRKRNFTMQTYAGGTSQCRCDADECRRNITMQLQCRRAHLEHHNAVAISDTRRRNMTMPLQCRCAQEERHNAVAIQMCAGLTSQCRCNGDVCRRNSTMRLLCRRTEEVVHNQQLLSVLQRLSRIVA